MGAMKNFYADCAEAGRCPISRETFDYLDDVECANQLDWIGYCEHDYTDRNGRVIGYEDCITLESARRLIAEGLANDEIVSFVECFGGLNRPASSPATTAARLAGEIVAAVTAGEELPEEWYRLDAYADVGEPVAWEVCRLVREDLEGTGIRV